MQRVPADDGLQLAPQINKDGDAVSRALSLTLQCSSTRATRTVWSTDPLASRLPSQFHPNVYTCKRPSMGWL
jgi:hypothetical protein